MTIDEIIERLKKLKEEYPEYAENTVGMECDGVFCPESVVENVIWHEDHQTFFISGKLEDADYD